MTGPRVDPLGHFLLSTLSIKCVDTVYNFYGYMPLEASSFYAAPLTGEPSQEHYKLSVDDKKEDEKDEAE